MTYESEWYYAPLDTECELIAIKSRNYGIAQLDGYVKLFSDTSYPSTATFTVTPATVGLSTTAFPSNYIFYQSVLGGIHNFEAIRLKFTGGGVPAEQQFISDINIVIQPKQERSN